MSHHCLVSLFIDLDSSTVPLVEPLSLAEALRPLQLFTAPAPESFEAFPAEPVLVNLPVPHCAVKANWKLPDCTGAAALSLLEHVLARRSSATEAISSTLWDNITAPLCSILSVVQRVSLLCGRQ